MSFVGALVLSVYFWLRSWIRAVRLAFSLPGPPALLLLGNIFEVKDTKGFDKFELTAYKKYGSLIRGWITVVPIFAVLDPKHLQRILGSKKLTDKNFFYLLMHNFLGEGLITSSGDKWKVHRKHIQPYFNLNTLSMFIPAFAEGAQCMIEQLKGEKVVKISTHINQCVVDILHQAVLGIPIEEREIKKQSPFIKGNVTLIINRILQPWLLLNSIYKLTSSGKGETKQKLTLQEFSEEVLERRKRDKELGKTLQCCLLDSLMEISENNPDFANKDVIDEVCTFMLAGQDSVQAAVAFTLYHLAKHQNIQEKAAEEINSAFSESATISMDTLNKMNYLELCIKETLRLYPSVPLFARKLSEDVKLDVCTLPAGCSVFISPYVTHRLPDYYPDPKKFDPERFSEENQKNRNPFAYIPFSAGPRNCIGYKFAMLEMKTIISTVLRNYKIFLVPGHEPEPYYRITIRSKGGVWLKLQSR